MTSGRDLYSGVIRGHNGGRERVFAWMTPEQAERDELPRGRELAGEVEE